MATGTRLTDTIVAAIKPPTTGQEEHADAIVTGLRLRIGTSGRKSWIVRTRAGGKVVNRKMGVYPTMGLADARKAASSFIDAVRAENGLEVVDRTFGEVARAWIEKVAKAKNRSWRNQERRLEIHLLPLWGDRRIREISRADVRAMLDGIEGNILPNRVLALARVVFRWALSNDWIEASPVEGVEKPKKEIERDRVLSMQDVAVVWDGASLLGYPFGSFVKMLLLTGQRRTETATMQWADIDLESATWTIPKEQTKSDRAHLVPLSREALALLDALPRFGPYVFSTDGETRIGNLAKAKRFLDTIIAGKGGALAPWRLHDLRRSVATHIVRLGFSTEVAGRVLNHAPSGLTAKVYALHDFMPEKRKALQNWGSEFSRIFHITP